MNKWTNEQMNKRMNKWTNERQEESIDDNLWE